MIPSPSLAAASGPPAIISPVLPAAEHVVATVHSAFTFIPLAVSPALVAKILKVKLKRPCHNFGPMGAEVCVSVFLVGESAIHVCFTP